MAIHIPVEAFDQHFVTSHDEYRTPARTQGYFSRNLTTIACYLRLCKPVGALCWLAHFGKCDDKAWVAGSAGVARVLESVGCTLHIEGLNHIRSLDGPCVFVANHMSTLETFVLPSIIRPYRPVTYVVKRSLTTMPGFGPIMRSRNPVVVNRNNPREDLQSVLESGTERLQQGVSIIVFPQATRMLDFDAAKFNSIGVKLAKRAGVPVMPLALLTDAWGQGRYIKDCGTITPCYTVHFRFGEAMPVQDQGKAQHAHICAFIQSSLEEWRRERLNSRCHCA